jgi:uncharacterized protein (UPF0261 family)
MEVAGLLEILVVRACFDVGFVPVRNGLPCGFPGRKMTSHSRAVTEIRSDAKKRAGIVKWSKANAIDRLRKGFRSEP